MSLRAHRQARLLSIRDLAAAADVSPQTIVTIESGGRLPRLKTMRKIVAALGVPPAEVAEFARAIEVRSAAVTPPVTPDRPVTPTPPRTDDSLGR